MRGRIQSRIPEGETLSREHLSNERTLLGWVRIGVNAIGIGILADVVAQVIGIMYGPFAGLDNFSLLGLGMVVLGGALELAALAQFALYRRSIARGLFTSVPWVYSILALSTVLLATAYAVYMVIMVIG